MVKKIYGVILILLVAAAAVVYFALRIAREKPGEPVELNEVRVQVTWVPNAQFAGYYVAMEKGYYRDEGLNVIINEYDEEVAVKDAVAEGKAEFGVDGADQVILGRSEGKPLKAVAVQYRISPTAFASLKKTGVKSPRDLVGKKIGILPDATGTIFKAMIRKQGIRQSGMEFIQYGYDFNMLYNGTVDVVPIYLFDEPYKMKRDGYEIDILLPRDYGIDVYGDTIFTTEQTIREHPQLVEGFVRATLKGWSDAIEDPEEAVDITLKHDHPDYRNKEYETFILANESPLVQTGEDQIGWMKHGAWRQTHRILLEYGLIRKPIHVKDAYTMEFLKKIYGE